MARDSTAYAPERSEAEHLSYRNDHNEKLIEPVDGKVADIAESAFGNCQEAKSLLDGRGNLANFSPEEKRGMAENLSGAFDRTDFNGEKELKDTAFEVSDRMLAGTYRDLDRMEARSVYTPDSHTVSREEAYADGRFDNRTLEALDRLGVNYRGVVDEDGASRLVFDVRNKAEAEAIREATGHAVSYRKEDQPSQEGRLARFRRERQEAREKDGPGESAITMHRPGDYSAERRELDLIREELASDLAREEKDTGYIAELMEAAVKYSQGTRDAEERNQASYRLLEHLKDDQDRLREATGKWLLATGDWEKAIHGHVGMNDTEFREAMENLEQAKERAADAVLHGEERKYMEANRENQDLAVGMREKKEEWNEELRAELEKLGLTGGETDGTAEPGNGYEIAGDGESMTYREILLNQMRKAEETAGTATA